MKITEGEKRIAQVLNWAPWLSLILTTLTVPTILFALYASGLGSLPAFLFLGFISGAAGLLAGLFIATLILFYRWSWMKKLRDKLARDGITVDKLQFFIAELTTAQRQTLKRIEQTDQLLADAYREALADKLTADRLLKVAKRELLLVERRLNRARAIKGTDTLPLQNELNSDRYRLQDLRSAGVERQSEAEAKLQLIEAAANRGANMQNLNLALDRLSVSGNRIPPILEALRLEQDARDEAARELRQLEGRDRDSLNE